MARVRHSCRKRGAFKLTPRRRKSLHLSKFAKHLSRNERLMKRRQRASPEDPDDVQETPPCPI